jgi:hypothetical protein
MHDANRGESSEFPRLARLIGVRGVGQQATLDGTRITLLSIEFYDDGFLITCRAQTERSDGYGLGRMATREGGSGLDMSVSDDRGRSYTHWPHGSGGSPQDHRWEVVFAPHVDRDASVLKVTIPAVRLRRGSLTSPHLEELAISGPVVFEVPLRDKA